MKADKPQSSDGPLHVVDAGPLLCYGAVPNGPRIAWRLLNPMGSPPAVILELTSASRIRDKMGLAAQVWLGNKGRGLARLTLTSAEETDADRIQADLQAKSRKRKISSSSDRGESECIGIAAARAAAVVTNDLEASNTSKSRKLEVVTTADLLRRDLDSGLHDLAETGRLVRQMRDTGLDIGENISGRLDLVRRRRD